MALPTVQNCKDYLRIEHSAEDAALSVWLTQSVALVENEIGRPVQVMTNRTWVLECAHDNISANKLLVPLYPIASEDSSAGWDDLTLTDADGTVLVEGTDYRLDIRTGVITGIDRCFTNYPYTIVADVGLEALPEYATRIEPVMSAAILDVVADRYQRRSPAAITEATGGDVTTEYRGGLPERVKELLRPWRIFHV